MADHEVEIVVEIPIGSRNKYEYDHVRHLNCLERRLFSATVLGDCLSGRLWLHPGRAGRGRGSARCLGPEDPTFPGCHVTGRPVAVFSMTDEKGLDAKIDCLPSNGAHWEDVSDLDGLALNLRTEIEQFSAIYKDLEPGKLSHTRGHEGRSAAFGEISASRERFSEAAPVRQRVERI